MFRIGPAGTVSIIGAGGKGRTYDGANGVLIERVPAYRHDHRIDGPLPLPFPFPLPFVYSLVRVWRLPVAIALPLGCRCGSRRGSEREAIAVLVEVEPREAVVHAAFDVLVAADREACDRDVGCGDAELRVCVSAGAAKWSEAERGGKGVQYSVTQPDRAIRRAA